MGIITQSAINLIALKLIDKAFKKLDSIIGRASGVNDLKNALEDYLTYSQNKYFKVKTLVHGNDRVDLLRIYLPHRIEVSDSELKLRQRKTFRNTERINELLREYKYLTVIGKAGSGKSTMVKYLFLDTIIKEYGIPFIIELRNLTDDFESILDYILGKLNLEVNSGNYNILIDLILNEQFVVFLDGFDEIIVNDRSKVIDKITKFTAAFPKTRVLITSRPYSYAESIQSFVNSAISEFTKDEIQKFVIKQLADDKDLAKSIISSILSQNHRFLEEFLSNPLLLSLFILTFQVSADIPVNKHIFYERVVAALFLHHDSFTKLGFKRERLARLTVEEYITILSSFSFITILKEKIEFTRDDVFYHLDEVKKLYDHIEFDNASFILDMKRGVALWMEEGQSIFFVHKSIQEYFAAKQLMKLDDQSKKSIYSKILEINTSGHRVSFDSNLLSMFKEIDQISYIKYYDIPKIEFVLLILSKKYNDYNVPGLLAMALRRITEHTRYLQTVSINHLYISLYIDILTEEFYRVMTIVRDLDISFSLPDWTSSEIHVNVVVGEDGKEVERNRRYNYWNIMSDLPEEIISKLDIDPLREIASDLIFYFQKELERVQEIVKKNDARSVFYDSVFNDDEKI